MNSRHYIALRDVVAALGGVRATIVLLAEIADERYADQAELDSQAGSLNLSKRLANMRDGLRRLADEA